MSCWVGIAAAATTATAGDMSVRGLLFMGECRQKLLQLECSELFVLSVECARGFTQLLSGNCKNLSSEAYSRVNVGLRSSNKDFVFIKFRHVTATFDR